MPVCAVVRRVSALYHQRVVLTYNCKDDSAAGAYGTHYEHAVGPTARSFGRCWVRVNCHSHRLILVVISEDFSPCSVAPRHGASKDNAGNAPDAQGKPVIPSLEGLDRWPTL